MQVVRRFCSSFLVKLCSLYIVSHFFLIIILDEITAFAPDESSYAYIFGNIYTDNFDFGPYAGWPTKNVVFLRILYLPARCISGLGFTNLQSIRIYSCLVGLLALVILVRVTGHKTIFGQRSRVLIAFGVFFPTFILWTSLGLRESFIFLWLVCVFQFLFLTVRSGNVMYLILLFVCSLSLGLTKDYLYILFVVALSISVFVTGLILRKFPKMYIKIIFAVVAPMIVTPSLTESVFEGARVLGTTGISQPLPTNIDQPLPTNIDQSLPTNIEKNIRQQEGLGSNGQETISEVFSSQTSLALAAQIKGADICEYSLVKQMCIILARFVEKDLNVDSQNSKKNEIKRTIRPASLKELERVPQVMARYLFSPFPFVNNGSIFLNLLSYESFLWWILYLFLITIFVKSTGRGFDDNISNLTVFIYIPLFLLFSTLIETNVGTALRHRSVLLILTLILIAYLGKTTQADKQN